MFDEVIADFKCPYCSFKITKKEMKKKRDMSKSIWQTKATAKLLDIYQFNNKLKITQFKIQKGWMEIHQVCPKCDKFVQAEIESKKMKYIKNLKLFSFKPKKLF